MRTYLPDARAVRRGSRTVVIRHGELEARLVDDGRAFVITFSAGNTQTTMSSLVDRAQKMMAAKRSEPIVATHTRDLIVFAIAILAFVAVAVLTGVSPAPAYALIAAFALGLCVALAYVWITPMVAGRK